MRVFSNFVIRLSVDVHGNEDVPENKENVLDTPIAMAGP
jgi:hypothetical protein